MTLCSLIFWGYFRIRHVLNVEQQHRMRQAAFPTEEGFEFKHFTRSQSSLFCSHCKILARDCPDMDAILERGDFSPKINSRLFIPEGPSTSNA